MSAGVDPRPTTNVARRTFGAALGFAPLALLLTSVIWGLTHSARPRFAGWGWLIPGLLIAALNAYLSFVRPVLFQLATRAQTPRPRYRHVSGFPLVGTLLLTAAALASVGAVGTGLLGIGALVIDTGGTAWFVIATWRDRSLWDG